MPPEMFSPRAVARIAQATRWVEAHLGQLRDPGQPAPVAEPTWVRVTSATLDADGHYPGVVTAYDPVAEAWEDFGTVRLKGANGEPLTVASRYACRLAGIKASGELVYLTMAQPGGGIHGTWSFPGSGGTIDTTGGYPYDWTIVAQIVIPASAAGAGGEYAILFAVVSAYITDTAEGRGGKIRARLYDQTAGGEINTGATDKHVVVLPSVAGVAIAPILYGNLPIICPIRADLYAGHTIWLQVNYEPDNTGDTPDTCEWLNPSVLLAVWPVAYEVGLPSSPGSSTYTIAGSFTWVAPDGVTSVTVQAWAGGGGGGNGAVGSGGGGGGGGEYRSGVISVTPGNSYTVVVGAAGTTGVGGGNSTFNATSIIAVGGGPGTAIGTGGAGGSGGTGTTGYSGGNGGNAVGAGGGAGGGSSAGTAAAGDNGDANSGATGGAGGTAPSGGGDGGAGGNTLNNGVAGTAPGGGGGGGGSGKSPGTGAAGAAGKVILTW